MKIAVQILDLYQQSKEKLTARRRNPIDWDDRFIGFLLSSPLIQQIRQEVSRSCYPTSTR